MVNNRFP